MGGSAETSRHNFSEAFGRDQRSQDDVSLADAEECGIESRDMAEQRHVQTVAKIAEQRFESEQRLVQAEAKMKDLVAQCLQREQRALEAEAKMKELAAQCLQSEQRALEAGEKSESLKAKCRELHFRHIS